METIEESKIRPSLISSIRMFFLRDHHLTSDVATSFRRWLRAFIYTFNLQTLILLALSLTSVYVCLANNWSWNMDFSLVAVGTVFPLTFSISQAYARRERATVLLANMKASVIALYFMHRDWDQSDDYPRSIGNDNNTGARRVKVVLLDFLITLRKFLIERDHTFESPAELRLAAAPNELMELFEHEMHLHPDKGNASFKSKLKNLQKQYSSRPVLQKCYKLLSHLSALNEVLTLNAGYTRGGEGGLSRTHQYFRYVVSNMEELRMIKEYRTPSMMRHACGLLFHIFAVILAPYFVHFCDAQAHEEESCVVAYWGSTIYVIILMLLYHIEQDMEHPFDESGLDDCFFTLPQEFNDATGDQFSALSTSTSIVNPSDLDATASMFLGVNGVSATCSRMEYGAASPYGDVRLRREVPNYHTMVRPSTYAPIAAANKSALNISPGHMHSQPGLISSTNSMLGATPFLRDCGLGVRGGSPTGSSPRVSSQGEASHVLLPTPSHTCSPALHSVINEIQIMEEVVPGQEAYPLLPRSPGYSAP